VRLKALVNTAAQPAAVPAPRRDAAPFHASLPGYQPTPVRELPELADELGLETVLLKDESHRLGLPAFKVLGAAWAIERVLREQPEAHTLVAASAGNHGRAVAHVAAIRGLRCRVFLPARSLPARRDAIAAEGAEVVVVDGSYEHAVAQAAAAGAEAGAVVIADVGDSGPATWVIDGYATLFTETAAQATYDLILVPVGVGSLAAAAARHAAEAGAEVIGVEPLTAACLTASLAAGRPTPVPTPGTAMAGLDCAEVSPAAWPSLHAGIHGTITVDDAQAREAMQELATAGLAIGESGAAPLAALRTLMTDPVCSELRDRVAVGPSTRVLLLATEGPTATPQAATRPCREVRDAL
jgi:diaminopropionate ammonia-lyase